MKKLNKKLNRTRNLSIFAIAFSGVMFIMWCCNVGGFSAVSLDTFVGVIVALLAIIVTFAIGWQILNAMDIRNNIKELESKIAHLKNLESQTTEQQKTIQELNINTSHLLDLTWAEQAYNNSNYAHAFLYGIRSLQNSMKLSPCKNSDYILEIISNSVSKIPIDHNINKDVQKEIKDADKIIRQQSCFELIKGQYEKSYNLFFQKVKLDDDQK